MRKVLFVDDDPAVLQGLRRMLHDQRQEWQMEFVGSGAEAMVRVEAWCPDVVVTDMRMPGMDGSALLKLVRQKRPEALRVVLSGQTEWNGTVQSVDDAHQFLLKPCEKAQLKEAIQRSERMERLVPDAALRAEIAQLSRLPMLGPAAKDLLQEMDSPSASLKKAAHIVEQDPGLAALALRMVHSAFFSTSVRVERASQAALLLGFDNLRGFVLATQPFQSMGAGLRPLAERLWTLGAETAYEARQAAVKLGASRAEENEAFTAGMLHEIGVLVLATLRPAQALAWEETHGSDWPADAQEEAVFGATHAAAGGFLLALWGLPDALVQSVAWHHSLDQGQACLVLQALHQAVHTVRSSGPLAPRGETRPVSAMAA
jgi:HD-like signal output (HDOD) protein